MVSCYHDDHNCKSDLVWDEDGWIVQIICAGCNSVIGFMHPQAALDIGGADSEIGMKILAIFPDWKATPLKTQFDFIKKRSGAGRSN